MNIKKIATMAGMAMICSTASLAHEVKAKVSVEKKTTAQVAPIKAKPAKPAKTEPFTLTSTTIKANGTLTEAQVFDGFGCEGKNISPALAWTGAPKDTKSFAITMYDPDAPTGSGWWHWTVYNIPATTTSIPEGAGNPVGQGLPEGALPARTDYGAYEFGGACPPKGDKAHRYIFTVYALSVENLDVQSNVSPALVGFMLNANALAKASFSAKYGR